MTTPSAPRAMALAMSWAVRMPPLAMSVTLSRMPSSARKLVDLADGVLDGHGDVLLGDVRRRAGAAVAAVEVDDVRAGVVAAHGHHVHVRGRGDLRRNQGARVDVLDPVEVLLVVFDRIDAMERERREQRDAEDRLAHAGHGRACSYRPAGGRPGRAWRPGHT